MSNWKRFDEHPDSDRRVLVRVPALMRGGPFAGTGIHFGRWDDDLGRWRVEGMPSAYPVDFWHEIPKPPDAARLTRSERDKLRIRRNRESVNP